MLMQAVRILVVEDSRPIGQGLCQLLGRRLGCVADLVRSYAEAVERLAACPGGYFLAILDLSLPDAQDGEIVDHVLEQRVPVIVYTSREDAALRKQLLSKNIIDYVFKNSQGAEVLTALVQRLHRNCRARVLVVDDSPPMRRMVRAMLKTYMFKVHLASNGENALAILAKNPDISLVITDYEMPGMNGVELCRRLRETHPRERLGIIGISAVEDEFLSVRFIKNGANDFIRKPFSREEFYLRVMQSQETIETFAKLRELNDLKNRFLGIVAHDLRNPINGIKGFSELLIEELQRHGSAEQLELAELINRSGTQMQFLVNDLLDISVIESGKLDLQPADTDLAELIRERVRIMSITAAGRAVRIATELEPLSAFCDPQRIAQVLDNLLSNAVKFSPQGSTVTVLLQGLEEQVRVTVRDQGPGIPKEKQHRLFETFARLGTAAPEGTPGTGLGLSIVKKIVETHGGRVWAESSAGCGASFFFSLPRHPARHPAVSTATCA